MLCQYTSQHTTGYEEIFSVRGQEIAGMAVRREPGLEVVKMTRGKSDIPRKLDLIYFLMMTDVKVLKHC